MSSTNESQIGKSGNIGTFAVAQFTEISGQTGGEVIDWWPHKEGISVIKLRPGLICENAGGVCASVCFGDLGIPTRGS